MPDTQVRHRWLRFTLAQLLIFSMGFAVGLGSLALWQFRRSSAIVVVRAQVYEMPLSVAQSLAIAPKLGNASVCLQGTLNPTLLANLQALERKHVIRCVADPNMMTIDGRPASFSIGGEIPYPVAGKGGVTIDYRKYGSEINLTPLVQSGGRIQLTFQAKISELDESHKVNVSGVDIPGLKARTVEALIESGSGQSALVAMSDNQLPNGEGITAIVVTPSIQPRP